MTIHTTNFALAALLAAATVATSVGFSFDAEARTFTGDRYVNRDKCYKVKKIPQLVEYDTKGIFVRGASRSWKGNLRGNGTIVTNKYHDPVYIQTTRVLEDQHYTLIPTGCR